MLNFRDIKFPKALNDVTVTNLQIVLNTQKNHFLNQAAQKITCHHQIFPPKKKPEINKISNPKKSCNHPCHLKSRVTPSPGVSVT